MHGELSHINVESGSIVGFMLGHCSLMGLFVLRVAIWNTVLMNTSLGDLFVLHFSLWESDA